MLVKILLQIKARIALNSSNSRNSRGCYIRRGQKKVSFLQKLIVRFYLILAKWNMGTECAAQCSRNSGHYDLGPNASHPHISTFPVRFLLTNKRRIHLRSASVRTYTFFTTGFPRFMSIRGARGLQAFDLPLVTNLPKPYLWLNQRTTTLY
jgi:hypothetical protein